MSATDKEYLEYITGVYREVRELYTLEETASIHCHECGRYVIEGFFRIARGEDDKWPRYTVLELCELGDYLNSECGMCERCKQMHEYCEEMREE